MNKKKILIVEDQVTTARILKRDLEQYGYDVLPTVSLGEDVAASVKKNRPDLVLIDIFLGSEMDGIEAAKLMRTEYNIPIIYLTACTDNDCFERALLTEPFGYLIKPFEPKELDTTIKTALNKHKRERELNDYNKRFEKLVDKRVLELLAKDSDLGSNVIAHQHVDGHIRKLHLIVEQSPNIIVVTDIEGKIEYVNPSFTKITGYAFAEVLGNTPRILNSGKYPRDLYKKMWETIKAGREWHSIFCNKKKNGELYWESMFISPLRNSSGVVTNFIKTSEDVTKQKLMEEEIKRHNVELEEKVAKRTEELTIANRELQQAFDKVMTLSGLIPICASCKMIRDDKGYWNQVEQYVKERSSAEFTHSICPGCKKKLLEDSRKSKERILVIDDEKCIRDTFLTTLENSGYRVDAVESGEKGIDMFVSSNYDLVFIDLKMPDMNGLDLLRIIRNIKKEVPVYVVSTFLEEHVNEIEKAVKENLEFGLLKKPLTANQILFTTKSVFSK